MLKSVSGAILALTACTAVYAFEGTRDQAAVNVYYEDAAKRFLVVEGQTYTMRLDREVPMIHSFRSKSDELIDPANPLMPVMDAAALWGPGRFNIYRFGTQMYEIHLRDLRWNDIAADIEVVYTCYAKRVFVQLNVTPRGPVPVLLLGWLGGARYTFNQLPFDEAELQQGLQWGDARPSTLMALPRWKGQVGNQRKRVIRIDNGNSVNAICAFGSEETGTRSEHIVLVAGDTHAEAMNLLRNEMYADSVSVSVSSGEYEGYVKAQGYYRVRMEHSGPRHFEEAWINPNQRFETRLSVSRTKGPVGWTQPAELMFNVHGDYEVLEAAVVTNADGFPLPVQVQVSKNFGSEFEEGKEEGDAAFSESWFPVAVSPEKTFEGRVLHLFGHWGTHPLKQISSIRFHHHYFHASLGPTETFCYVPFEFAREDKRNYFLADVRGLSNAMWTGQPQHDHVSVVGLLRYRSNGQWVNNRLTDTRIYLTAPNLANFAVDYMSEDGNVKTTVEVTEWPQEDEARSFMKLKIDVLNDVAIDDPSAQHLRFLNAGAYIVNTKWPKVTYTDTGGQETTVDVPGTDTWALEGVPLASKWAYAAAYPHKNGCMAFFVNRVSGQIGGQPLDAFGLSCFGGATLTELFLTGPAPVSHLKKGDMLEAHLFVMPYGGPDSDQRPARLQRVLYGEKMPSLEVLHGTASPGLPFRVTADPGGFAEFVLTDGEGWTPILVEGFVPYKAPMLWENRDGEWFFIDQQIYGNDWYQPYVDRNGTHGFVFVVNPRTGQKHHYLVTMAPNAKSITQRNGAVTVTGGPMDFIAPVPFATLKADPVQGTALHRFTGNVETATSD
ncbi:MAG: hypothetical protein AMXMBFR84_17750 [Candidatus Hydrogenedentota bacterium]